MLFIMTNLEFAIQYCLIYCHSKIHEFIALHTVVLCVNDVLFGWLCKFQNRTVMLESDQLSYDSLALAGSKPVTQFESLGQNP